MRFRPRFSLRILLILVAISCVLSAAAPTITRYATSAVEDWQWNRKRRADLYKLVPIREDEVTRRIEKGEDGFYRLIRFFKAKGGGFRRRTSIEPTKVRREVLKRQQLQRD